jgi:hypothetical protein
MSYLIQQNVKILLRSEFDKGASCDKIKFNKNSRELLSWRLFLCNFHRLVPNGG